jgi:hypothetical protein
MPALRTFSGSHAFRSEHLAEAMDGGGWLEGLLSNIRLGTCPRCNGPLLPRGEGEIPSGSRVTACRCIPICYECGEDEGFTSWEGGLDSAADWPIERDEMMARIGGFKKRTGLREISIGDIRGREHPGGWADPDNIVEEE